MKGRYVFYAAEGNESRIPVRLSGARIVREDDSKLHEVKLSVRAVQDITVYAEYTKSRCGKNEKLDRSLFLLYHISKLRTNTPEGIS